MKPQPRDNSVPLTDGFNFTPIYKGKRVKLRLGEADRKVIGYRGLGLRGTVTDLDTGKTYKVYGRSCGLPNCQCDSEIKEVSQPK